MPDAIFFSIPDWAIAIYLCLGFIVTSVIDGFARDVRERPLTAPEWTLATLTWPWGLATVIGVFLAPGND